MQALPMCSCHRGLFVFVYMCEHTYFGYISEEQQMLCRTRITHLAGRITTAKQGKKRLESLLSGSMR